MKKLLATTAAITLGFATQSYAQSFTDTIVADLEAQGYTDIEVETDGDKTIVEAVLGDTEYEFTYDSTSQELLETEEELFDEDDEHDLKDEDGEDDEDEDEDEDEDDEDDDDEDEDEDDEEDDD
ncbi:MAG: PepSY domain-containing protein [Pseudomonadota bacterium]|nr:PepSY domain-containing protein [Pseudomonadota bacterium]